MNILELNHPLTSITLHPRKQKEELLYICNLVMVIRLSYLRFIELLVPWEESLIFSDPWDLKLMKFSSQNLQIKATFYQSFKPSCTKGGGGGVAMTPNGFLNITLLGRNQN